MDRYTSLLKWLLRLLTGIGALFALTPFWASWKPNAKVVRAAGPVSVDLSHLEPGQKMTVVWRGKPIWVLRRTPEMIAQLQDEQQLRDPTSHDSHQPIAAHNQFRSLNPEYAVLVGLCTHLGCIPKQIAASAGAAKSSVGAGFFCPCHGSRFDVAGRVYKDSPASSNLEVPPYHFRDATVLVIGEEA